MQASKSSMKHATPRSFITAVVGNAAGCQVAGNGTGSRHLLRGLRPHLELPTTRPPALWPRSQRWAKRKISSETGHHVSDLDAHDSRHSLRAGGARSVRPGTGAQYYGKC